jgi:hypothetical protein
MKVSFLPLGNMYILLLTKVELVVLPLQLQPPLDRLSIVPLNTTVMQLLPIARLCISGKEI